MMTFEAPSQVLDHGWLTLSGGVQGLYMTYRIRQERARREEFPWLVPKTLKLRTEWRDFIEESTSRFNDHCLAPFSFEPPSAGGARTPGMNLKPDYAPRGIQGEKNKFQEIAMLAGLGREALEQDNKGKLTIEGVGKEGAKEEGIGKAHYLVQGALWEVRIPKGA
jgi:hypothetical protein